MSVQLDWQKEVGEDGWPRRQEGGPPGGGLPRWTRWVLLALVVTSVGIGVAFWQLSNAGLRTATADVQEAIELAHYALQQGQRELFQRRLDPLALVWQDRILADWQTLSAWATGAPAPQIEQLYLNGDLAQATLRWEDPYAGDSFRSRQWFRLVQGEWRLTQPRDDRWGAERTEVRPHLTVIFRTEDGDIVDPILDKLEAYVSQVCRRYGLPTDRCNFWLRWDLLDENRQPIQLQELALPPLASATADEMDGPLYLMGASDPAWRSPELRQRMQRFHPGPAFVAQSRLDVLRPAQAARLPAALPGEPGQPLLLPSPWLYGVADDGMPHGHWQVHVQRKLADAVMRRVEGVILGSGEYVNAAWALHQALLVIEHGLPEEAQLAPAGQAPSIPLPPASLPDFSGLGAALQAAPDDMALTQLADLARYLQSHWSADTLHGLTRGLGTHAYTDPLLRDVLGIGEEAFLAGWRADEHWHKRRGLL